MHEPVKAWQTLESEYIFKETWFNIRKDKVLKGSGREMDRYYVFEFTDWVTVLPITTDGKVILVKQYRYALGEFSYEIPGGVMDAHETDPLETAKRELREETGYAAAEIIKTATISPNPATQSNLMHCYLATGCEPKHMQELDENEEIELVFVTMEELKQLLRENKIIQSLHISSIFYTLMHLGEMQLP